MGKAESKRGRERQVNNQQCTRKMHTKTATSKRTCFSNVLPHTSNGGSGKRAARERSEEEKSPGVPDCTGRGEEWEGTQRVGVAAEVNMWEMLVSADSPTLHRPQGTHTQSKQARGVGM